MKTKQVLDEADVQRLLAGAQDEARRNEWSVSVAVVDDGGHLLGFSRMDGANIVSAEASIGKARTAAMLRKPSKVLEDMIAAGRVAALSIPLLTLEGGEPVLIDGLCAGALGVSGVKSSQDAQVARAAINALTRP